MLLHFSFCFDDKYAQYAAVCIRGIINNHKNIEIKVHILSDALSSKSIARLKEAVYGDISKLCIHIIDDSALKGLPLKIWPVQAWYRILLPSILPDEIDRVLYLDCDTLVMSDLSKLFEIDMNGKAFAAVEDPQSFSAETFTRCGYPEQKKYICSGIMLFNLSYCRNMNVKERLVKLAIEKADTLRFPDQDAYNILCQDTKILLPLKYGVMDAFFKNKDILLQIPPEELLESLHTPQIVHFAGCSPWKKELRPSLFSSEWDKINNTLYDKAKVEYISKGISFIKMIGYKTLHPIHTIRKYRSHITLKKAIQIVSSLTNNS